MGGFLLHRLSGSLSLFFLSTAFFSLARWFLYCFCLVVVDVWSHNHLSHFNTTWIRCFKDNFHVFPCPWFGKSTNPPIVKTLQAVCYCGTPAAATKYCGHDQEKAAFFSFLGTLLSCQRPGFAHAYFPFQIFKYSQILQPQMQSFSFFSQNTCSLINPFHLTTMRQLSAKHLYYCFVR